MSQPRTGLMQQPDQTAVTRLVERQLAAPVTGVERLTAGLGLRRFYRVTTEGDPSSVIARVEAPEDPAGRPAGTAGEPPLEPLRSFLEHRGLPVPARLGGDPELGIDLLEDLGPRTLASAASGASAGRRVALYGLAIGLIPRLQRLAPPSGELPAFRRSLDRALFDYKAELFARWSLPDALGREPRFGEVEVVREAFRWIAAESAAAPARLAHRDFQSHNLHLCGEGSGGERLVMIDIQGALLAPPEYDLVCLLRDSYLELPEHEVQLHLEQVRPLLPDRPDPESFARRFDLLTLSRKGKDHARFVYAARSRGERRYAPYLPATVRALRPAAARVAHLDPSMARLAEMIRGLPESPCAE
jgi:aminoglycoside/choline kinase family phosphotransferase